MGVTRNLGKAERVVRVVIGIILIAVGFALSGVWKVLSLAVGIGLMLTSLMGY